VVEQDVGGPRRAHAEEGADDARDRHRRDQRLALEPLREEVDRRHRHHLDVADQPLLPLAAQVLGEAREAGELERIRGDRIGSRAVDHRLDQPPELGHPLAELLVDLGVALRELGDRPLGALRVGVAQQVAAVGEGGEGLLERQDLVAVPGQLEVADDPGAQQRDDVGAAGELEPLVDLLGGGRAADLVTALEHQDLAAGARQVGRADQAVVPGADDHGVVDRGAVAAHGLRFLSGS
jgi:hypothetical protein